MLDRSLRGDIRDFILNTTPPFSYSSTCHSNVRCSSLWRPMKIFALLLAVCSVTEFPAVSLEARAQAAEAVLNFEAPRLQGGSVRLESLRGRTVLLHFWSPFCSVCPTEIRSLDALRRMLMGQDIEILSVMTMDVSDRAKEAAKSLRSGIPILVDADRTLAGRFKIKLLPVTIIIGPDGVLLPVEDPQQPGTRAYRFDGVRSWANEEVARSLVSAHESRKPAQSAGLSLTRSHAP